MGARRGRDIEVCLNLRNTGQVADPQVTLTLLVPFGASVENVGQAGRVENDQIYWTLTDLEAQSTKHLCATFTSDVAGTLSFAPVATGTCAKPTNSVCSTSVSGIPAILLEVVDVEDPIEVGSDVTYEIKVKNQGTATGKDIRIVCVLQDDQEFVSADGPTPVQASGNTLTLGTLASLNAKNETKWRIAVKAVDAGDIRFGVELTSAEFERPVR